MKTTLEQLRTIDNELIIDGNCVMLHDKVEYINHKFGYFTDDVNDENVGDFYFDHMHEFENDNGGITYSENFPNIVNQDEQEWVKMMKQSNTTDDKLVVSYNIASSLFPVMVTFPTDVIEEGVEYEVPNGSDKWLDPEDRHPNVIESNNNGLALTVKVLEEIYTMYLLNIFYFTFYIHCMKY